jgi:hypothetical protein
VNDGEVRYFIAVCDECDSEYGKWLLDHDINETDSADELLSCLTEYWYDDKPINWETGDFDAFTGECQS